MVPERHRIIIVGNLMTGALVDFTGLSRPTVTKRLDRLYAAEYVEYLHEPTALWQLTDDPWMA